MVDMIDPALLQQMLDLGITPPESESDSGFSPSISPRALPQALAQGPAAKPRRLIKALGSVSNAVTPGEGAQGMPEGQQYGGETPAAAPAASMTGYDRADELRRQAYAKALPTEESLAEYRRPDTMGALAGLAMSTLGGSSEQEIGKGILTKSMANLDKARKDPYAVAAVQVKQLENEANIWDKRAAQADTLAEKRQAAQEANRTRLEALQMQMDLRREIAGQGLALRRESMEQNAANANKGRYQIHEGNVLDTLTGESKPLPGGAAGKSSDQERVAAGYLGRMQSAEKLISSPELETGRPSILTQALGAAGEFGKGIRPFAESTKQQRYRQAQEDWVRAKLRKESGAVIGANEMADEIRTYFPQPGESTATAAQKAQARAQAEEGMKLTAGRVASVIAPSRNAAKGAGIDNENPLLK